MTDKTFSAVDVFRAIARNPAALGAVPMNSRIGALSGMGKVELRERLMTEPPLSQ